MAVAGNSEDKLKSDYAERVKGEFLSIYKELAERVSDEAFSEYEDLLRNDGLKVKTDAAVVAFKTMLVEDLTKAFERMWESGDISQSLEVLELLKERYKDSPEPKWRPHGRSAWEQTLPLRSKVLAKREKYLESKLEQQKRQLEEMIVQIEENRKMLEEHSIRRNWLSKEIDLRLERLGSAKDKLAQQLVEAVDRL